MGGQIRRGRIWCFWGAPIFSPEVPKYPFLKGFRASGLKIGATTDLTPHLRPSDFGAVDKLHAQYDWTTGVRDNGSEWRKFRAVPPLYPLRSLVLYFVVYERGSYPL